MSPLFPILLVAQGVVQLHGTGTLGATRLRPAPGGGSSTQVVVEQALARVRLAHGPWRGWVTLDVEGFTMPDGVLNAGAFGEGFVDRRHPHTFVHELLAGVVVPAGAVRLSLTAGKGFAAFGTDDPMHRPALKYPVNHHWAQILERWVLVGGVALGPLRLEGTLFNGDEPARPEDWPTLGRFGDSWAVRAMARPLPGVESQVSYAFVRSPEHQPGAGPDARKWSVSTALTVPLGAAALRGLAEWALTDEGDAHRFTSVLAEAELRAGGHRPYARFEWTSRPEEERTGELFRTVRPHLDDHVIGVTRWTLLTAGYGHRFRVGALHVEPLVEATIGRVTETSGGLFDPSSFYGRDTVRSLTAAVRVHWGTAGTMGRYGVQEPVPREGAPVHAH